MEKTVSYKKLTYKEFGYKKGSLCDTMYKMAKDWGFWFGDRCCIIKDQDMTEFTLKKAERHHHKFVLYRLKDKDTFYLVQYCKNRINIFYCYDGKQGTILRNLRKAYEKGVKEAKEQEILNESSSS